MRFILTALARCWILIQSQNPKDSSDVDSDEGPLRKHRRLTSDHWTAVSSTMDMLKKEHTKCDVIKVDLRTRDVGVLCSERVPVNDKCIMVGTTGIAALKAEYGDDFTNFEIIQDVGYSSESSIHLSGDDVGTDHPFNVRIYKYSKDNQPLNLKQELEAVTGFRGFHPLGSSLESSSSAAVSLDDSGLGTGETLTSGDSGEAHRVEDEYEQEELDYLDTVLDECVDFGANATSEPEELHFNISGIESDDPSDNFHNRRSFTTSAQVFYKMISVDSDNGEGDNSTTDNNISSTADNNISSTTDNNISSTTITETFSPETTLNNSTTNTTINECNSKVCTSDSDPDITIRSRKNVQDLNASGDWNRSLQRSSQRYFCSTPIRNGSRHHGLKRKRDHDAIDATRMSNRVRSWLNRCATDFSNSDRLRRSPPVVHHRQQLASENNNNISSCDASCECTSSSADEGNVFSSTSSFLLEDNICKLKTRMDSCSAEGSVETVVHALLDSDYTLLPPPPSSTASYGSDSKNCSTNCCGLGKGRRQGKAVSDGDLQKRRVQKKTSDSSTHNILQKHNQPRTTHLNNRFYSSLPTVLRHPSDSSTDDNCITSIQLSHSDTRTTPGCTTNRSSSSEMGRRRRRSRKKSSSSNRSSTSVLLSSGDHERHRSKNSTSRRRQKSQRSEFLCAENGFSDEEVRPLTVEIPPEGESVGFDHDHRRASSVLLSPVESDIVLTHLEEQSIVSDQVWDGYQEMPYLSEGYSEATVDEDAVRKLTEFGDDYGSAIGQPLRVLEPADTSNKCKADCAKVPKKNSKVIPTVQRLSSVSRDSDSESEDLHYVIEESDKAFHFARNTLKKRPDSLTPADQAELLATCGTHLSCLQTICQQIIIDGREHSFSAGDLTKLHYLIQEWQDLKKSTEMYEETDDPARQKYLKAQANIDALFNKMSEMASCSILDVGSFSSWEDVEKNLATLQMVLTSLHEAKEQLLAVNLEVHRFTTEYGMETQYKDCSLKSDITELYRKWEDIYEENGQQLCDLELLRSDWKTYNEKLQSFRAQVKQVELLSEDDCDTVCLLSAEDSKNFRRELQHLEDDASSLRDRLKGGHAWKKFDEDLKDLKQRINAHDGVSTTTSSPSVNHRMPSTIVEEDADDHFEDAIQQLCEDNHHSNLSTSKKKTSPNSKTPKKSKSRLWRIARVAVPVQVALVLLYCLACYLEPSCCNMLNNFNFSFTPQLRYLGGRPPV